MKIINPYTEILTPLDGQAILQHIELCGRVCYKSEDKITDTSAAKFVAGIIKRGHEAVLEHFDITVKFVCDRGVSHEIVRHRMASYCQESTRYCNYSKEGFGGEITVIRPFYLVEGTEGWQYWKEACWTAERRYFELLNWGCTPQEARAVLPTSLKTEVVMTANLREWRHFFKLRTAPAAHPQMREVAIPLLHQMRSQVPVIFDDIEEPPMKLCDRCPQAGSCLLNYLGKACHKLRMQECPEVVPTTLELMHNMDAEELAAFLSKTFCQSLGKTQLLEWLNKEVPNETL